MSAHATSLLGQADSVTGLIDTHTHVFDPAHHPYSNERRYTPPEATVDALLKHQTRWGIAHSVLVQPSVYGTGNACLLAAIARIGADCSRGIAVVELDRTTPAQLQALHVAGVRGIRLNLEVRHETDDQRTTEELLRAAALIEHPGWCVQIHCSATLLQTVARSLDAFRVPLVFDHFAGLRAAHVDGHDGSLNSLLQLLDSDRVYVKLSALYRASTDAPHYADLAPLARRLIAARPDRLLWGSDWPHTDGRRERDDPRRVEPFREVDLAANLAALKAWAPDTATLKRILVDNAAELYGFATETTG